MTSDGSSAGGLDKLPVWEPTQEEFGALLQQKEYQEGLSETKTLGQKQYFVVEKLKVALATRNKITDEEAMAHANRLVGLYMDELRATMGARLQADGDRIRNEFLALSESAPAEISAALKKAEEENPEWYTKHQPVFEKILGHFSRPSNMADDGKFEEGVPDPRGESYLLSRGWLTRTATDGKLVQEDYEQLRKVHAVPGTAEHQAVQVIIANMRKLQMMDPLNRTFIQSTPSLRPGARFALSFLLAGAALISFLVATKTKRLPKKGLLALGLLLYLNRNRDTQLSFLSGPRYTALTKELRGSEDGKAVFEALGEKGNRTAVKEFVARERKRNSVPIAYGKDLPSSDESYATLMDALGIDPESAAGKRLRRMPAQDIDELASVTHKFTQEEMEIAVQFVRRDIDVPAAVASLPLQNPADANPPAAV